MQEITTDRHPSYRLYFLSLQRPPPPSHHVLSPSVRATHNCQPPPVTSYPYCPSYWQWTPLSHTWIFIQPRHHHGQRRICDTEPKRLGCDRQCHTLLFHTISSVTSLCQGHRKCKAKKVRCAEHHDLLGGRKCALPGDDHARY